MKRDVQLRSAGRPDYNGQYALHDRWQLSKAVASPAGGLEWVEVGNLMARQTAVMGYKAVPADAKPDDYVRNETLRQYAVNLMAKNAAPLRRGPAGDDRSFLHRAEEMRDNIQQNLLPRYTGKTGVANAIADGLEVDRPLLSTIEHMLAIAERTSDLSAERITYGALGALKDLRGGIDPSGGMFDVSTQLAALGRQFPVLAPALEGLPEAPRPAEWFVVRARDSGKFDDGYYGWDGALNCEAQIHRGDALPYVECPEFQRIPVGQGEKPALSTALERVAAWLETHEPDSTMEGPSF